MTIRAFRVGGIRFLRVGRVQLSFCLVRRKPRTFHITGMTFRVAI